MFSNQILLITGGTGSFGNAVLKRFLDTDISEIRIFSRDEKKQEDMRKSYNNSKIKFYIGDVRDYNSVLDAFRGVDYIFHAAALKQVPSCEFHPIEAVKTNIMGTQNVIGAAINSNIKCVVCLSTDKAVYPINAMGISKSMMEKIAVAKSRISSNTKIVITRYGNVMATRGSVIPLFMDLIKAGKAITITDPNMTRFMMTLDSAIDLVLYAFKNGKNGEIIVQKSPATTIKILAEALSKISGKPEHETCVIGPRHGEKLHEVLLSREEVSVAKNLGDYYSIPPDLRDLNYSKFIELGYPKITDSIEYNSDNTIRLDLEGVIEMLMELPYIKDTLVNI